MGNKSKPRKQILLEKNQKAKITAVENSLSRSAYYTLTSFLRHVNLKTVINPAACEVFNEEEMFKLEQLLPSCDRSTDGHTLKRGDSDVVNNVFFNLACRRWMEKLKEGNLSSFIKKLSFIMSRVKPKILKSHSTFQNLRNHSTKLTAIKDKTLISNGFPSVPSSSATSSASSPSSFSPLPPADCSNYETDENSEEDYDDDDDDGDNEEDVVVVDNNYEVMSRGSIDDVVVDDNNYEVMNNGSIGDVIVDDNNYEVMNCGSIGDVIVDDNNYEVMNCGRIGDVLVDVNNYDGSIDDTKIYRNRSDDQTWKRSVVFDHEGSRKAFRDFNWSKMTYKQRCYYRAVYLDHGCYCRPITSASDAGKIFDSRDFRTAGEVETSCDHHTASRLIDSRTIRHDNTIHHFRYLNRIRGDDQTHGNDRIHGNGQTHGNDRIYSGVQYLRHDGIQRSENGAKTRNEEQAFSIPSDSSEEFSKSEPSLNSSDGSYTKLKQHVSSSDFNGSRRFDKVLTFPSSTCPSEAPSGGGRDIKFIRVVLHRRQTNFDEFDDKTASPTTTSRLFTSSNNPVDDLSNNNNYHSNETESETLTKIVQKFVSSKMPVPCLLSLTSLAPSRPS